MRIEGIKRKALKDKETYMIWRGKRTDFNGGMEFVIVCSNGIEESEVPVKIERYNDGATCGIRIYAGKLIDKEPIWLERIEIVTGWV